MREQLKRMEEQRKRFTGTFVRFGQKSGWNGYSLTTVLLSDIKDEYGKVFINDTQYFGGIDDNVWNFYIDGYQVLDKWLKSKKGRRLTSEEIETFVKNHSLLNLYIVPHP